MKKNLSLRKQICIVFILLFNVIVYSQPWLEKNIDKDNKQQLSFYEMQSLFDEWCYINEVKNGYIYKDNESFKVPFWKQFKRMEWYWERRIHPITGEFPKEVPFEQYKKYLELNPNFNSPAGNWQNLGPHSSQGGYAGLGRLNCVAFRPQNNNVIYAGSPSGGLWKTSDGGNTWIPLTDNNQVLGVSDIIVINQVSGPDVLYVATGDKNFGSMGNMGGGQFNDNNSIGVLKSMDGGVTWSSTGLSFSQSAGLTISRLIMDPNSGYSIMYAATSQGVYRTMDGGNTWSLLITGFFMDMEISMASSSSQVVLFASTINYSGSPEIYKITITNGNPTWTKKSYALSDYRIDLAVTPANSNYVYAVISDINGGLSTIERSTDAGNNYSTMFSGSSINLLNWDCNSTLTGGQGSYDLSIAVDPNNENTVFVGGINTWKSTNGGSSWSITNHWFTTCSGATTIIHADKHMLKFHPSTGDLFECNDGGLYKSSNGGNTWTDLSNGMAISQIYRLGVGQASSGEIMTGLQDNGSKNYSSISWSDVLDGDGMECIVNPGNNNIQYAEREFGDIYRTTDHWTNSTQITPALASGAWVTPYVLDSQNSNVIYVGYQDVYKSVDQGNSWSTISSNLTLGVDITSLDIASSNSLYICAATYSDIFRTTNGGASWNNITGNLPVNNGNITYLAIKSNDPNTIWVCIGGYIPNSVGVWETIDGGLTWNNISGSLPALPVMCIVENKQAINTELYVGTDVGVFVKHGPNNWMPYNTGLPNVVITELDIYYDDNNPVNSRLYAATYGRGLWETDLYTPLTADFVGVPTSGIIPLTVSFTDLSIGNNIQYNWQFGDGGVSSLQNPVYTYAMTGQYGVTLQVTNNTGTETEHKPNYITVNDIPPVADFVADITNGDVPLQVQFTDLSSGGMINSWQWSFGDGGSSTEQNPSYIYNASGTYTVSLTVHGPGGTDTKTRTDYIIVNDIPPVADFTADITSGDVPLQVQFSDLSSGIINSWQWSFGDGGSSTEQNPSYIYNASGTYTVSLAVIGPGGTDTKTRTDYIIVTQVGDPLSVIVSADPEIICQEENSQLFANAAGGTGNYSFSWTSDPAGFTSSIQNPVVAPLETTSYTVVIDDGTDLVSDEVEITVYSEPLANAGEDQNIEIGSSTLLLGGASEGSGSYSWRWEPSGFLLNPNIQNPVTIELTSDVQFELTVTDLLTDCSDTDLVSVFVYVNTQELVLSPNEVQLIPNPVDNLLRIVVNQKKDYHLKIFDQLSNEVLYKEGLSNNDEIDLSHLPAAIYYVQVIFENGDVIKKLMVL